MASVISQLAPKVKVSRESEHHSASQSGMMFALNKLPKFVGAGGELVQTQCYPYS